jgi:hypothetical protein
MLTEELRDEKTMLTEEIAHIDQMAKDILRGTVKEAYEYCEGYIIYVRDNIVYLENSKVPLGVNLKGARAVFNGDQDLDFYFNQEPDFEIFPTISFNCLSRFLNKSGKANPLLAAKYLAEGKIIVIDATADKTIRNSKGCPALGFTRVATHGKYKNDWHRSASVLFSYDNRMIIMGQDEGSYFGSEIAYDEKIKTVNQAFKALMPKHLWRKKGLLRQGEWFFVPVSEKNVPASHKCILAYDVACLTRDRDDSAKHAIYSDDIRILDNKVFALDPHMEHSEGDHQNVEFEGWCTFERNTALRSYSEEGVD